MSEESKQSHSWVPIGPAYAAVIDDAIAALVYHATVQRGRQGGPGGDQQEAGPGWYLVWVEEPHRHYQLTAPPPRAGSLAAELDRNALAALAEAGEVIDAKLAGGGTEASGGANGR